MKVKDSKECIIAYHGSNKKFDHFDFSYFNEGVGDGGMYGKGFYFCESPELAKSWHKHGYLYKCLLIFKNPFISKNNKDMDKLIELINAQLDENDMNTNDMTEFFEEGYDSIISLNEEWNDPDDETDVEYHNQYVAFEENQIKILNVSKY